MRDVLSAFLEQKAGHALQGYAQHSTQEPIFSRENKKNDSACHETLCDSVISKSDSH